MLCILNVGTVPTLCILNVGTVATFSHFQKGKLENFQAHQLEQMSSQTNYFDVVFARLSSSWRAQCQLS